MEGVEALLAGIGDAIEHAFQRPAGFVLDPDDAESRAGLTARWQSVSDRLRKLGAAPPSQPPAEGLILEVPRFKTVVGVWLMPDNQRDGTLEDFLQELITTGDGRIEYARYAAGRAKKKLGALFPDVAMKKAQLHTWLAWQEKPGLPYGSAVKAHYFGHDNPTASAFVAWFKRLYQIP